MEDCSFIGAAVPVEGRAMSIREEARPEKKHDNDEFHGTLVGRLVSVLPEGCKPAVSPDIGMSKQTAGISSGVYEAMSSIGTRKQGTGA